MPRLFPLPAETYEFFVNGRGVWFGWTSEEFQLMQANLWRSKVLQRFPRTEQGWQQCWGVILNQFPALAVELRSRLVQDEPARKQRADDLSAAQELQGMKTYGRVERCRVLGGFGFPPSLKEGDACALRFTSEQLWLQPEFGTRSLARWAYSDLSALEFSVAAQMRQGNGTLLLEAMTLGLMGTMLVNRVGVARRQTAVRVQAAGTELFLMTASESPRALQARFAEPLSLIKGANQGRPTEPSTSAPDVAAQLQQLAALHEQGSLTDEQFEAAKARVIGL